MNTGMPSRCTGKGLRANGLWLCVALLPALAGAETASLETAPAPVVTEAVVTEPVVAEPAPVAAEPAGRVYTVHFPESERARIREEIRNDMLATLRRENWAEPGQVPEWLRRLRFSGDLTLRGQVDTPDTSNGLFENYQAINAGAPVNMNAGLAAPLTIPYLNSHQDRQSLKVRARAGFETDVSEMVDAGLRLSTGSLSTPVSATQTLGHDMNKFSIGVDRAWIRARHRAALITTFTGGRMANPWMADTDLLWDRDLGMDGLALEVRPSLSGDIKPVLTLGAMAYGNTDANYPSANPVKLPSEDQWLFGAQLSFSSKMMSGSLWRAALGYHDFTHIEGRLSSPCEGATLSDKHPCDTDGTRPGFLQKGNTVFPIRLPKVFDPTTDPLYQYVGLASPFRIASLHLGYDMPLSDGKLAEIDLDLARNLAFDRARIAASAPLNNIEYCPGGAAVCPAVWSGGGDAWQLQFRMGHAKIVAPRQWSAQVGYRYVESDAVVDAYTDSDFHLGGTNAEGVYLGGTLGVARNTSLAFKWMSASEITGYRYGVDVFQLDLNARF